MWRASVLLVLLAARVASADLKEDPCACSPAKPGFFRRGNLTGDWDGIRDRWNARGIIPQAVYAGETFAAPGLHNRLVAAGLFVVSLDLELDKLVDSHLGQLHLSTLAIHGRGLTAELDDIYGVSGHRATPDVPL